MSDEQSSYTIHDYLDDVVWECPHCNCVIAPADVDEDLPEFCPICRANMTAKEQESD